MNRINSLKKILQKKKVDAVVITDLDNIFYLIGFTGSAGILIIYAGNLKTQFISDPRYAVQSEKEIIKKIKINIDNDIYVCLINLLKKKKEIKKIAVESGHLTFQLYSIFKNKLKGIKILGLSDSLTKLRMIKDDKEIKLIKKAIEITDTAVMKTFQKIKKIENKKEKDIAAMIEYEMKCLGAEKTSFDTITASGSNSAMPHAKASSKKIKLGVPVLIDCGCIYKGYCSDLTRTFFFGKIPIRFKKLYEQLLYVQKEVIKDIKPGVYAKCLDLKARSILKEFNLDKFFTHSLGHGVGVKIHEFPKISSESDFIIQSGMVFTIEPGIYIPNFGGIRIEDMVLVTEKGHRVLSICPKELDDVVI